MIPESDPSGTDADLPSPGGGSPARSRSRHPLGPVVIMHPLERPVVGRLYALGILATVAAILITAARIRPEGRRFGTHQQLGLPPCGFVLVTGLPCPTCGMTTAYAYTVRGQWLRAARAQSAGFVLALATIAAGVGALHAIATGRRPSLNWYRVNPLHVVWWITALFVLAWALVIVLGLLNGSLPARQPAIQSA